MALAMLARALSLRRANQRAKVKVLRQSAGDSFPELGTETSPEQSAIHSSRVSQSIDALYVLSCLRDGLSLADTFASDEVCAGHAVVSCRPSDVEKLTLSSQSLSEHARSSDAWDRFSFSLSSSGSESVESLSKDAVRCCSNCTSSSIGKREDFCLVFNTGQLVASPSPPAAIASDCCSFLMGRKSNHNEEDLRGLASQKVEREKVAENVQRRDKVRQSSAGCAEDGLSKIRRIKMQGGGKSEREGHEDEDELQKGANVAVLISSSANGAEGEEESGELQRLLTAGAMEAIAKQSGNPYLDFRESMLQMMTASSAWNGRHCKVESAAVDKYIEDLLYCYLRLNSMELHELITRAFSDTYSHLFSMQT